MRGLKFFAALCVSGNACESAGTHLLYLEQVWELERKGKRTLKNQNHCDEILVDSFLESTLDIMLFCLVNYFFRFQQLEATLCLVGAIVIKDRQINSQLTTDMCHEGEGRKI